MFRWFLVPSHFRMSSHSSSLAWRHFFFINEPFITLLHFNVFVALATIRSGNAFYHHSPNDTLMVYSIYFYLMGEINKVGDRWINATTLLLSHMHRSHLDFGLSLRFGFGIIFRWRARDASIGQFLAFVINSNIYTKIMFYEYI